MNKMQKRALAADSALLLVAVIWGGGFVASKIALNSITPFYLLGIRVLGAGLILSVILWKKIRHADRQTIKVGLALGMFLLIGQGMQIFALQYTTPGKQAFLVASYTLFIPFISWVILKRRPQLASILAGIIMLIGIAFLSLNENLTIGFGDGLSILSAIFFAVHMVLISRIVRQYDPLQISVFQLLSAGSIGLMLGIVFEPPLIEISSESGLALGYLLFINTAIASSVQNFAQKFTTATRSSIIVSLESVFGLFFSILILNEQFTNKMIFGIMLIVVAVVISKMEKITT